MPPQIYYLNDPSAKLTQEMKALPLPNPCPPFTVQWYDGNPGSPQSPQYHAMQTHISVVRAINVAQKYLENKINSWSKTKNLMISPRAGVMLNAFYDRNSLRFFYSRHPKDRNNIVFTCESADVVCHETGHAILDKLRPDLWSTQNMEVFAFHESFSDFMSILVAFSEDKIAEAALRETNGNLMSANLVSRIAEELGSAIAALQDVESDCLRNAANDLKYVVPQSLKKSGKWNDLLCEPHNFSRVFTGSLYEILVKVYQNDSGKAANKVDALKRAVDKVGTVVLNAVRTAPLSPKFFHSVANEMVVYDITKNIGIGEIIKSVFVRRNILSENVSMVAGLSEEPAPVLVAKLSDMDSNLEGDNPLYDVNVEVPVPAWSMDLSTHEWIDSVKFCLDYVYDTKMNDHNTGQFYIDDGKLCRSYFSCPCKYKHVGTI